jgi:hypothetical protein
MKISLRKASQLQTAINDAIKGIELETEVSLNEFQDPETVLAETRQTLLNNMARVQNLNTVLYTVRNAVATANATSGINLKLGEVAMFDKRIGQFNTLGGKKAQESMDVIKGKLDKIKNRKEDARTIYGYESNVATSVLKQEDITGFKGALLQLKKAKQKLQDEILELNVRTEIEVGGDAEKVLVAEGLA